MHLRHSCWVAAMLAGAAAPSFGQSVAPPPWPNTQGAPPQLAADPVHPLKLGALRVTLFANTLGDVQRAIGAGEVTRHGKGTETLDWLCYTIPGTDPVQRLWLSASELAGNSKIDGVTAVELAEREGPQPSCPELPAKFRPVRFEDGLWLGGISAEQRKALAVPAGGSTTWGGMYRASMGSMDIVGTIAVEVRRSRIVAIHAAHN